MIRFISQSFAPRGLIGTAAMKPPKPVEERLMIEVLDPWGRPQQRLPLGHAWIEGTFYAREGFSMRKVWITPAGVRI